MADWLHSNYVDGVYSESIAETTEAIFGLFLLLQMIENENIQLHLLNLHHEWPKLHNETEFNNYKVRMPTNIPKLNEIKMYNLTVMAIFKNETMNLKLWLEHYLWQGVQHFYLIDNGSNDMPLSILQSYIDKGIVTYYYREEKHQQSQHYRYVFDTENVKNKTKWLCICDLDEFFFGIEKKLSDALEDEDLSSYDVIYTNSYFYGSDNLMSHPKDIRTDILHREEDDKNGIKYIFKPQCINSSDEIWIHWLVKPGTLIKNQANEITQNDKIRLNHYRIQSFEYFKTVKMTRGDVSTLENEKIRDLNYFNKYTKACTIKDDTLKQIIENNYVEKRENIVFEINEKKSEKNTALIVEPRFLKHLPFVINDFSKKLGDNWKIVFYCGEGLCDIWTNLLNNKNVEIRELNVVYLAYHDYCDFMKSDELWETLYGDYVLVFTPNSIIVNEEPFTIEYFMDLNKSYIGGNQFYRWNELTRENIYPQYKNFQGGLSLRKRMDMIKIIKSFGVENTIENVERSQSLLTDAEDVYFTIGCYKLGLPVGDDEKCSHFSVHTRLVDGGFFGANGLEPGYYLNLVHKYDNICDNIYLYKSIQDIDNEILRIQSGEGFFSNCSVKLFDLILYFNATKKLPLFVDGSKQFDLYKCGKNKDDLTNVYFSNNFDLNIDYKHPINFRENHQYIKYDSLPLGDLNPFVEKYFTPSETIQKDIRHIETKYCITNYENICVLFYRGNDKITEINLPSYETYITLAKQMFNENKNVKFLIQSDEKEFIDDMLTAFPVNSFYFKDETRVINKNSKLSVDKINMSSNFVYSQYFLAITIIMSKCKYVLCNSGNCSLWIALYKGHTDNLYQVDKIESNKQ
jgi:hypothetical protein